jgi:hypothetical protein
MNFLVKSGYKPDMKYNFLKKIQICILLMAIHWKSKYKNLVNFIIFGDHFWHVKNFSQIWFWLQNKFESNPEKKKASFL